MHRQETNSEATDQRNCHEASSDTPPPAGWLSTAAPDCISRLKFAVAVTVWACRDKVVFFPHVGHTAAELAIDITHGHWPMVNFPLPWQFLVAATPRFEAKLLAAVPTAACTVWIVFPPEHSSQFV
jgi:hypothetical protein